MTFSKNDTMAMKGVAILFMIWGHLFNNMSLMESVVPLFKIHDENIEYLISFAVNPVQFFLFLSGYGLYLSYLSRKRNNTKRIMRLYLHYWIVLCIFVSLGAFIIGKEQYPGSIQKVLLNFTGLQTSYNHEMWFLFPYCVVALLSEYIFFIFEKMSSAKVFIISFAIYIFIRLASRFDVSLLNDYIILKQLDSILTFQFSFTLGYLTAKTMRSNNKPLQFIPKQPVIAFFILIFSVLIIILLRNYIHSIFYPFYVFVFSTTFMSIKKPNFINNIFENLGKRSTSIWFCHTYFCYYFFHDFIYSFKYSILIFIILLFVSYITAICIDYLNKKVQEIAFFLNNQ